MKNKKQYIFIIGVICVIVGFFVILESVSWGSFLFDKKLIEIGNINNEKASILLVEYINSIRIIGILLVCAGCINNIVMMLNKRER